MRTSKNSQEKCALDGGNSKYKRPELDQAQHVPRTGQYVCTIVNKPMVQGEIAETVMEPDPKGVRFYSKNNGKSLEDSHREVI